MRFPIILALLLILLAVTIVPFSQSVTSRPIAVKLGYTPDAAVIESIVGEHQYLAAQLTVSRVIFYYGTLVEKLNNRVSLQPEYFNMYKTLETAVKLDPYNLDAYYFAQAAFTWEINRIDDVNSMLKYGMKYRSWDYQLPFFIAFNSAYFKKDYPTAAKYMARAAELSKQPLYGNLAARYFYDAGRTDLGLIFLDSLIQNEQNEKVKKIYQVRKQALMAVRVLENAVSRYREVHGVIPKELSLLVKNRLLTEIPPDPYGGTFYIDPDGSIKSTSKLAYPKTDKEGTNKGSHNERN